MFNQKKIQRLKRVLIDRILHLNENIYYKWFFTKNSVWSQKEPNFDETIRWEGIKEFLEILYPEKKPIKIVDLGCGRGWLSNLLAEYGYVIGVEPVKAVVKFGQRVYPNLKILHGNAETLIADGNIENFDLIVSSEVIEHIKDKDKSRFVGNINRLLRKHGHCIVTTPRKDVQEE